MSKSTNLQINLLSILFLTLKVFSATGGIEKVCRVAGKVLFEHSLENNEPVTVMSMHDSQEDAAGNGYFPGEMFKGFGVAKSNFVLSAVKAGRKSKTVILSHINLLVAGWLIKKLSPRTNVILMAHGIEVWNELSPVKRKMLSACDRVVSVSSFTSQKIQELHALPASSCFVLNNCIDPYLNIPTLLKKDAELLVRYGFRPGDKILLTLTRLSAKDRYKGYDYVLESMVKLLTADKTVKYLLAGKYDGDEKKYLDEKIKQYGIEENVVLTGFIPDEEIPGLFSLADIYVMPSIKEGFGIVFVEAMYYGLPVIAGNADGSSDALLNGYLGLLIKPDAPEAITNAIETILADKESFAPDHALLLAHFGYESYKVKLGEVFGLN